MNAILKSFPHLIQKHSITSMHCSKSSKKFSHPLEKPSGNIDGPNMEFSNTDANTRKNPMEERDEEEYQGDKGNNESDKKKDMEIKQSAGFFKDVLLDNYGKGSDWESSIEEFSQPINSTIR